MAIRSSTSASAVPARSHTASRPCDAPRSAASTTPAASFSVSAVGGRPPVERRALWRSTTRPAASSTPTRWRMVDRDSPVAAMRSLRLMASPFADEAEDDPG